MSATRSASTGPRRAPRVASRSKRPRFRPRAPEDFFSPEAWRLLSFELQRRARDWQVEGPPRSYYYGRDSESVWATTRTIAALARSCTLQGKACCARAWALIWNAPCVC
jgi:hypothetical protein